MEAGRQSLVLTRCGSAVGTGGRSNFDSDRFVRKWLNERNDHNQNWSTAGA